MKMKRFLILWVLVEGSQIWARTEPGDGVTAFRKKRRNAPLRYSARRAVTKLCPVGRTRVVESYSAREERRSRRYVCLCLQGIFL